MVSDQRSAPPEESPVKGVSSSHLFQVCFYCLIKIIDLPNSANRFTYLNVKYVVVTFYRIGMRDVYYCGGDLGQVSI